MAHSTTWGFVPAAEVTRDGTDAVLTLELPGVDPDNDVEVQVADRRLTVSGERRSASESRGRGLVRELRYGRFRRSFVLPEHVDADAVEAAYEHGLLTVRVRGVHRQVPEPRTVTIRSGNVRKTDATGDGGQQAA